MRCIHGIIAIGYTVFTALHSPQSKLGPSDGDGVLLTRVTCTLDLCLCLRIVALGTVALAVRPVEMSV